jgi:hypothetical protein
MTGLKDSGMRKRERTLRAEVYTSRTECATCDLRRNRA